MALALALPLAGQALPLNDTDCDSGSAYVCPAAQASDAALPLDLDPTLGLPQPLSDRDGYQALRQGANETASPRLHDPLDPTGLAPALQAPGLAGPLPHLPLRADRALPTDFPVQADLALQAEGAALTEPGTALLLGLGLLGLIWMRRRT